MKIIKKLIFPICIIVFISFNITGCSTTSSNTANTINVFNWGDYIDSSLIEKFEKETGIKVNYSTYDTNEMMYQKLKTNPQTYDIVIPSDYMIQKMLTEGMVDKINFDNIPNYKYIDEKFKNLSYDPNNEYSVPYMWGTIGIIYDPKVVKEEVDSWDILWNEKYKRDVYMFNSIRETLAIGLIKAGYDINSINPEEINEAKKLLIQQRTLTRPLYVVDQVKDFMISGERSIATVWSGDAIFILNENPDLKYVIPKEGSNKWFDSLVIPKGAPNKAGAESFINFLCDPENAKVNVEYIEYSTPNAAAYALLDEETKNNPAAYPSDEVLDNCTVFTDLDKKALRLYEEAFMEVLSN